MNKSFDYSEFQWEMLSSMERVVWAVAFASVDGPPKAAVRRADHMLDKLRMVGTRRANRLDPEIEAARANVEIPRHEFDMWYRTCMRIRHPNGRRFTAPTDQECEAAYHRFMQGRDSYY